MLSKIGGFLNAIGSSSNQVSGNALNTPPLAAKNTGTPEGYTGGTLPVTIKASDTQETFVHRGLSDHAAKAGLRKNEAKDFADKWTNKNTSFNHRADGNSTPYTKTEFKNLKTKQTVAFDLSKEFDAAILADLNERVGGTIVAETNPAYTADEKKAMLEQKNASANQAAISGKPILTMIDGKTSDGQPINADTALTRYIQKTYNPPTESGSRRVWGDKINEMVDQAKTDGVKVDLQFDENGTALVGVSAADKQKLDRLFGQAVAKTILGEQASIKAGKEEVGQVVDIPIMAANGIINAVNHTTEPVRGTLETLGVDTSGAKLPKIAYQSEYGQKNGRAGEIGTEMGVVMLSAPALLKTTVGKVMAGVSGTYNAGAGLAGVDPTEKDAAGKAREMSTFERGTRIVGGGLEILGARPSFETAGQTGKIAAQESETVEMLTTNGNTVRVQVPKSDKPIQSAEDLNLFSKSAASKTNNAVGGAYKDISTVKNGVAGEVHHMPANTSSPFNNDNGPAIWMEKGDHFKTASWGRGGAAHQAQQKTLISEGRFREAVQMDIADIHSKFGNKYDQGIEEMLKYVDELEQASKLPKAAVQPE